MADLSTLQGWLTEAEQAQHELSIGKSVVEVWRDGRRITYSKADLAALRLYIADLKRQIADLTGVASDDPMYRRTNFVPRF